MKEALTPERFEALTDSALTDCEARDVQAKLAEIDLDDAVIDVAVAFERNRRIGTYTAAIYSALGKHQTDLAAQKAEIDQDLALTESLLGRMPAELDTTEYPLPLSDELLERLAAVNITRDTFVEAAMAYGHPQNIASRAFRHLGDQASVWRSTVNLDEVFVQLMRQHNPDGKHPLLGIKGFGPSMLDATFAVADAYLTARETQEAAEQDADR